MGAQSKETMLLAAAEEPLRVRRAAAKSATDIGANVGGSAPIRTLLVRDERWAVRFVIEKYGSRHYGRRRSEWSSAWRPRSEPSRISAFSGFRT
jgi:hypothetical protein